MNLDPRSTAPYRPQSRAVSPVIGVVLMVAITVILAAAIGAFVFGLSPSGSSTAPIASVTLEADADHSNVTIVHDGGDPLHLSEFSLLLEGDLHETPPLNDSIRGGDREVVDTAWSPLEGELVLRHDPSGEIVARTTVT